MVGCVGLSLEIKVPFSGVMVNSEAALGLAGSQSFLIKLQDNINSLIKILGKQETCSNKTNSEVTNDLVLKGLSAI